jgi:hypothetical protein
MDQATYQRWWPLHLRAARGEELHDEERSFYEEGRRSLEQETTSCAPDPAAQAAQATMWLL